MHSPCVEHPDKHILYIYNIYIFLRASYVIFLVCIFKISHIIFCENVFSKNFLRSYLFMETYVEPNLTIFVCHNNVCRYNK